MTAAHCAKTLVTASALGSPALQHCARLLLPGIIECVARVAALDGETLRALSALEELDLYDNRLRSVDGALEGLRALRCRVPLRAHLVRG